MAGAIAATTPLGILADQDAWSLWWRFNKEQYLGLPENARRPITPKDGDGPEVGSTRVQPQVVFERIVPALYEVLDENPSDRLRAALLLSLARIGEYGFDDLGETRLQEVLVSHLASKNSQLAETSCIGLGILGSPSALTTLSALLHDTHQGRKLVGDSEVSLRMRAFAAYGIGLLGQRTENPDVRRYATHALVQSLDDQPRVAGDDRVASIIALGMIDASERRRSTTGCPCGSNEALADRLLELLEDERDFEVVRAHVPGALARLTPHVDSNTKDEIVGKLSKTLRKRSEGDLVRQGCAQALGIVGDADGDPGDVEIRRALIKAAVDGNRPTRSYSLIALAQVAGRPGTGRDGPFGGTDEVQRFLVKRMARAKSHERKWTALALGILGRGLQESGAPASRAHLEAVRKTLAKSRSQDEAAVCSIAAGLCRDAESTDALLERLEELHDAELGHAALGLGLGGVYEATEDLHAVLRESRHQAQALEDTAIALTLLDDPDLVSELTALLDECDCLLSKRNVAVGLGRSKDARATEPLLAMLDEKDAPDLQRVWAALGLALLAEKDEHPWGAHISIDVNYRANPASLTSASRSGVLDLP